VKLLLATTNQGKLGEIRALLAGCAVELVTLNDLPPIVEPEEAGDTFEENARLKALYYAARSGLRAVAEDSGLVIDALDGEPGVRSARYVRPDASYAERFASIFSRLDARADRPRTARFVCALAVADGTRVMFETTGTVEGIVASAPSGAGGFGYDPIFHYPPYGATLAEVSDEAKRAVSHRGQAFHRLAAWLERSPATNHQPINQPTTTNH